MNSFTITAIGYLAADPEPGFKDARPFTRICLLGNDYAGKDQRGSPLERTTRVWFVAFEAAAETLAKHARKGDQLIVQAQIRAGQRADSEERKYEHSFVVQSFKFGAPGRLKREQLTLRNEPEAAPVAQPF